MYGADDGNRTRVSGLGSEHSAIELHPRGSILAQDGAFVKGEKGDLWDIFDEAAFPFLFVAKHLTILLFCGMIEEKRKAALEGRQTILLVLALLVGDEEARELIHQLGAVVGMDDQLDGILQV